MTLALTITRLLCFALLAFAFGIGTGRNRGDARLVNAALSVYFALATTSVMYSLFTNQIVNNVQGSILTVGVVIVALAALKPLIKHLKRG